MSKPTGADARKPSLRPKCEGNCTHDNGEHVGAISLVNVRDPRTGKDWGEWDYCEAAIAEDRRRGFIVRIIEQAHL